MKVTLKTVAGVNFVLDVEPTDTVRYRLILATCTQLPFPSCMILDLLKYLSMCDDLGLTIWVKAFTTSWGAR
jgi:hypothetical protein